MIRAKAMSRALSVMPSALVATNKRESLQEVLDLIEVEYTVLTPVLDPFDAMKDDAPKLHPGGNILSNEHLVRGDAHKAVAEAAYTVTETYKVSWEEHAFLETECAIAWPSDDGGVNLITASQSIYDEQREISNMLKIDPSKVHVRSGVSRRRFRRSRGYERPAPCALFSRGRQGVTST